MIEVTDKGMCCGCGACVAACPVDCIGWREDAEGFLYPLADAGRCIGCGRCEAVCPMLDPGTGTDPRAIFAVKNPDEGIRMESSSGGLFSLLAENVLDAGGAVFGAAFDTDWSVRHTEATGRDGLSALRGSKYLQSRMEDTFRKAGKHLKDGREVLFSGTSCQIAGLRNFLGRDYPGLLAVETVCHSIPSPKVWKQYLKETAGEDSVITSVTFRDKSRGWKDFSLVIKGRRPEDTAERTLLSQTTRGNRYMRGFLRGLYSRPSCPRCPAKAFASGADLAIADFWGADEFYPAADDNKGITLAFALTRKGEEILKKAITADSFTVSLREAVKHNPRIMSPVAAHARREEFFNNLGHIPVEKMVEDYTRRTLVQKIKRRIRGK